MSQEIAKPITINDLPATFELRGTESSTLPGTIITVIGVILLLVGGVTLLTGPDSIVYDTRVGMTFEQMIQAYPGPIVSVGFLIVLAGQGISSAIAGNNAEAFTEQLHARVDIPDSALPEGYRLHLEAHGGPHYSLKLVAVDDPEYSTSPEAGQG